MTNLLRGMMRYYHKLKRMKRWAKAHGEYGMYQFCEREKRFWKRATREEMGK